MLKQFKTLIIIFFAIIFLTQNVNAAEIMEINSLIENAKEFDGHEITVQGEVIGEEMERGNYSWININDGTNAIGIWLKNNEAKKISNFGNYKYKGDTVKITGIFLRACDEHGGEADIHNITLEIIEDGHAVKELIPKAKIVAAVILSLLALFLLLYFLKNKSLI